jgi:hypothetical protein
MSEQQEITEEVNSYLEAINIKIDDLTLNQQMDYVLSEVKDICDDLVDRIIDSSDENDDLLFGGINLKYHVASLAHYIDICLLRCDFDDKINTSDEMAYAVLNQQKNNKIGDIDDEQNQDQEEDRN